LNARNRRMPSGRSQPPARTSGFRQLRHRSRTSAVQFLAKGI
jgi:hypothetical protein